MTKKLFVGNLSFITSANNLINTFSDFGNVLDVKLVMDHITNRSKGFAFIEMNSEAEAQKAIQGLNGKDLDGRNINVSVAKTKVPETRERSNRW